jgi:hypothetical protein
MLTPTQAATCASPAPWTEGRQRRDDERKTVVCFLHRSNLAVAENKLSSADVCVSGLFADVLVS